MRRRYRWDEELKQMVEISPDWTDAPRRAETITEELVHGGNVAPDGTDISTRRRRREYMRRAEVADYSDFTETWKKAAEQRAKFFTEGGDHQQRREEIGRAAYQLQQKRRR